ncbi:MAG: integrase arm-type DNA-binding domain-containing protein [Micavibrio sp.]
MKLTHKACEQAPAKEKPYKIHDGGGMYLEVMPNGSKYWRLKYNWLKKEKRLALGVFPRTSLADARRKREEAKKQLSEGIDPNEAKKEARRQAIQESDNTFRALALEWHENTKDKWAAKHGQNILHRLENDILPYIGDLNVTKIKAPEVLAMLRKVEQRGALDIAGRCRQICRQVFLYGIQTGKCENNPAEYLKGALKTHKTKHFAALEPRELPELLMALERNDARLHARTRRAIRLSMLTFLRPGELRQAEWSEIDYKRKQWLIPAAKMKARKDHIVLLSEQAIALLKEQFEETGHINTPYVFPSQIKPRQPMSNGTVLVALKKLGFAGRMTAHGFRALARTAIREELEYDPDVIEAALAHKPLGALGAAYDRSIFINKRKQMMQDWANYIDRVAYDGKTKVVPFRKAV